MKKLCFFNIDGEIITQNDARYEKARQEWNRAIQKYPIAIVYCENNEDVSEAVVWASSRQLPIRVRSGGHNYEGYSTDNGVVIIDISRMNNININYVNNTIKVQGGVKNSQLYNTISPKGYPFPGGTCPTVGVSGYTLGGGWGYSARKFGLGCDSLAEVEMIDYKGNLLRANYYENTDLFWALRGAGGQNFGVVVSMTYHLPKKVEYVTYVELYYPKIEIINQVKFFDVWQNWIASVDHNINLSGGIYNSKDYGVYAYLRGLSYKNLDETKLLLSPFYKIEGLDDNLEQLTFYEAITKIQASYPKYEFFKSSGRFTNIKYSACTIEDILKIVNQPRPKGSYLTQVGLYGLGGKISDVPSNYTAFFYRDANYILSMQTVFEDNTYKEINNKWFDKNFKSIYEVTKGSYVNFPYNKLECPGYSYYGDNIYRLRYIKRKYDPCNVFSYPQGLGR
ncbi:MAG: FAD-binding protein [Peptostreptococcaceae bacterium]